MCDDPERLPCFGLFVKEISWTNSQNIEHVLLNYKMHRVQFAVFSYFSTLIFNLSLESWGNTNV
jgi:hypothetical protein